MGCDMIGKFQHCCEKMVDMLSFVSLEMTYIPKFREYGINYAGGDSYQVIDFCPWCGSRLPDSLRNAWFEKLDELGMEPEDDIPIEMRSDAWWVNI